MRFLIAAARSEYEEAAVRSDVLEDHASGHSSGIGTLLLLVQLCDGRVGTDVLEAGRG